MSGQTVFEMGSFVISPPQSPVPPLFGLPPLFFLPFFSPPADVPPLNRRPASSSQTWTLSCISAVVLRCGLCGVISRFSQGVLLCFGQVCMTTPCCTPFFLSSVLSFSWSAFPSPTQASVTPLTKFRYLSAVTRAGLSRE